jgi:TorA maturation chaperone TorD
MTQEIGIPAAVMPVPPQPFLSPIAELVAQDADVLAVLHDNALTQDLVVALHEANFPACLGLQPATPTACSAWEAMQNIVGQMPTSGDAGFMDRLSAEYAAIYLTGAYGASPVASFWLNREGTPEAFPAGGARARHTYAGLLPNDWRQRPEDHLVMQLHYLSSMSQQARTREEWANIVDLLDAHMLRWIHAFASRVIERSALLFYPGLIALTASWLDTLRDLLASYLHVPDVGHADRPCLHLLRA